MVNSMVTHSLRQQTFPESQILFMMLEIIHFWIFVPEVIGPRMWPRHPAVFLIQHPLLEISFPESWIW